MTLMTDTVEQAQSEVAAAEAHLAAAEAEATAQAAAQLPEPPTVEALELTPEAIAQIRLADGTARPDGREPSTIPEPRVESQDA